MMLTLVLNVSNNLWLCFIVYQNRKVEEKTEELYKQIDSNKETELLKDFGELRRQHTMV